MSKASEALHETLMLLIPGVAMMPTKEWALKEAQLTVAGVTAEINSLQVSIDAGRTAPEQAFMHERMLAFQYASNHL